MSCSRARQLAASLALLAGALVLCASLGNAAAAAAAEKEPVLVTLRNSGPSYDINDVERTRLSAEASENMVIPPASRGAEQPGLVAPDQKPSTEAARLGAPEREGESERQEPIGHITIRHIFLLPVAAPSSEGEQVGGQQEVPRGPFPFFFGRPSIQHEHDQQQSPSESGAHFLSHRPHLFGADEASRPPLRDFMSPPRGGRPMIPPQMGGEREMSGPNSDESQERPLIDPLRMMIQMMHHAFNPEANGANMFSDLNRDASANRPQQAGTLGQMDPERSESGAAEKPKTELEIPASGKPQLGRVKNETREDIVEIDGKKFLRKSVTSKHVGDNMFFMTKRLIFTPLNETETTAPVTAATTTTTGEPAPPPELVDPKPAGRPSRQGLSIEPVKEEPEVSKHDNVGPVQSSATNGAPNEPTSVSAEPTTEMPRIPTTEAKPGNPEIPAPLADPASVPTKDSTPASGLAQAEGPSSPPAPAPAPSDGERPRIPTVSSPPAPSSPDASPKAAKEEPESRRSDENTPSAAAVPSDAQ